MPAQDPPLIPALVCWLQLYHIPSSGAVVSASLALTTNVSTQLNSTLISIHCPVPALLRLSLQGQVVTDESVFNFSQHKTIVVLLENFMAYLTHKTFAPITLRSQVSNQMTQDHIKATIKLMPVCICTCVISIQEHQTLTVEKACSDQVWIQTSPCFVFSTKAVNKALNSTEFYHITVLVSKQL